MTSSLYSEAAARGIVPPTSATLKKYGMTELDWLVMLEEQGWVCPIMGKVPDTGRFVIDHEHVRGWKTMTPENRRKYVRGIVSRFANGKYLARGLSVERAANVLDYLKRYEMRKGRMP